MENTVCKFAVGIIYPNNCINTVGGGVKAVVPLVVRRCARRFVVEEINAKCQSDMWNLS